MLNDPQGRSSVDVPDGYRATQLVNGQEIPVDKIPLSSGRAQVIVETKTGNAGLTSNQTVGYNEVSQGTVTGVGNNATNAGVGGAVPSDTPVVILRPK